MDSPHQDLLHRISEFLGLSAAPTTEDLQDFVATPFRQLQRKGFTEQDVALVRTQLPQAPPTTLDLVGAVAALPVESVVKSCLMEFLSAANESLAGFRLLLSEPRVLFAVSSSHRLQSIKQYYRQLFDSVATFPEHSVGYWPRWDSPDLRLDEVLTFLADHANALNFARGTEEAKTAMDTYAKIGGAERLVEELLRGPENLAKRGLNPVLIAILHRSFNHQLVVDARVKSFIEFAQGQLIPEDMAIVMNTPLSDFNVKGLLSRNIAFDDAIPSAVTSLKRAHDWTPIFNSQPIKTGGFDSKAFLIGLLERSSFFLASTMIKRFAGLQLPIPLAYTWREDDYPTTRLRIESLAMVWKEVGTLVCLGLTNRSSNRATLLDVALGTQFVPSEHGVFHHNSVDLVLSNQRHKFNVVNSNAPITERPELCTWLATTFKTCLLILTYDEVVLNRDAISEFAKSIQGAEVRLAVIVEGCPADPTPVHDCLAQIFGPTVPSYSTADAIHHVASDLMAQPIRLSFPTLLRTPRPSAVSPARGLGSPLSSQVLDTWRSLNQVFAGFTKASKFPYYTREELLRSRSPDEPAPDAGPFPQHPLVALFLEIASHQDFDAYVVFKKVIDDWKAPTCANLRQELFELERKEDIEKDKVTKQQLAAAIKDKVRQLDDADIGIEYFWRELTFSPIPEIETKLGPFLSELVFRGQGCELINGNILTFNRRLLDKVVAHLHHRFNDVTVIAVLGPQSSAKSTLLNLTFGCDFEVGAGRCTKGMFIGLASVRNRRWLVLDTEGLMSMAKESVTFDNQVALFAVAAADVVLVNIKGELGLPLRNILEVAALSLSRGIAYSKGRNTPNMTFVLRDMTDLDPNKQGEDFTRLSKALASATSGSGEDTPLKLSKDSFVLLPAALHEGRVEAKFIDALSPLTQQLSKTSRSQPLLQLANHFSEIWEQVQRYQPHVSVASVKELFVRSRLNELATEVMNALIIKDKGSYTTVCEERLEKTKRRIDELPAENRAAEVATIGKATLAFFATTAGQFEGHVTRRWKESTAMTSVLDAGTLAAGELETLRAGFLTQLIEYVRNQYKEFIHRWESLESKVAASDVEHQTWKDLLQAFETETNRDEKTFDKHWVPNRDKAVDKLGPKPTEETTSDYLAVFFTGNGHLDIPRCKEETELIPDHALFDVRSSRNFFNKIADAFYGLFAKKQDDNERYSILCASLVKRVKDYLNSDRFEEVKWRLRTDHFDRPFVDAEIASLLDHCFNQTPVDGPLHNTVQIDIRTQVNPEFRSTAIGCLFAKLRKLVFIALDYRRTQEVNAIDAKRQRYLDLFLVMAVESDKAAQRGQFFGKLVAEEAVALISTNCTTQIFTQLGRAMLSTPDFVTSQFNKVFGRAPSPEQACEVYEYVTNPKYMKDAYGRDYMANLALFHKAANSPSGSWAIQKEALSAQLLADTTKWAGLPDPKDISLLQPLDLVFAERFTSWLKAIQASLPALGARIAGRVALYPAESKLIASRKDFCDAFKQEFQKRFDAAKRLPWRETDIYQDFLSKASKMFPCDEVCPLCGQKCTQTLPGHSQHSCEFHLTQGYGGCSYCYTDQILTTSCTEPDCINSYWQSGWKMDLNTFLPFPTFMRVCHPDWTINLSDPKIVSITDNLHRTWRYMSRIFCAKYGLVDAKPSWVGHEEIRPLANLPKYSPLKGFDSALLDFMATQK